MSIEVFTNSLTNLFNMLMLLFSFSFFYLFICLLIFVCACVCVCVCARARARVCVCERVYMSKNEFECVLLPAAMLKINENGEIIFNKATIKLWKYCNMALLTIHQGVKMMVIY